MAELATSEPSGTEVAMVGRPTRRRRVPYLLRSPSFLIGLFLLLALLLFTLVGRIVIDTSLADPGDPPRVGGVRTDHGDVAADVVVDAGGRRSPLDRWLAAVGARPTAVSTAECGLAYFGRQYRLRGGARLPAPAATRVVAGLDELTVGIWAGDNATMQLVVAPLAADRRFAPARR